MNNWQTYLKGDAVNWLLEESNPSVRYFTLRWLLDKPEDDADVVAAQEAVAQSEPVQKLLKRQRPEGYWGSDPRPLHGTGRYLNILFWLGYRGNGDVQRAMEYRMAGGLLPDGAYGYEIKGRFMKLPCHGAILLQHMLRFGYRDDPRAKKLLNWIVQLQESDGAWPCVSKVRPFSCSWATADVLRAYRDLPADWVTPQVATSRQNAVEMFLEANIYQYGKNKPSPRWFEFGFPIEWDSDILEVLALIGPFVSPNDERIQESLALVLDKQDEQGRWPCEKHPKGGRWMQKFFEFEELGQPSKWVTLHAMKMLKSLFASVEVVN